MYGFRKLFPTQGKILFGHRYISYLLKNWAKYLLEGQVDNELVAGVVSEVTRVAVVVIDLKVRSLFS